ncbi:uncharacterized protein LOC135360345 [Latimeria chalumnae]|uniref:uncharacterized protein LOC135360345 n=1 Tax=Latimeria chalumnae TaxID=7897 RepID=UPI00313B1890
MPISSGAEGHIGVGVDTSIKWLPEGGKDVQFSSKSNSYLQRYFIMYPKARKTHVNESAETALSEELLNGTSSKQPVNDKKKDTKENSKGKKNEHQHDKKEINSQEDSAQNISLTPSARSSVCIVL